MPTNGIELIPLINCKIFISISAVAKNQTMRMTKYQYQEELLHVGLLENLRS